jgi:hypothetical protein
MNRFDGDPTGYARHLYGKSKAQRLARINYTRARRGMPTIASLSETTLRRPMERG